MASDNSSLQQHSHLAFSPLPGEFFISSSAPVSLSSSLTPCSNVVSFSFSVTPLLSPSSFAFFVLHSLPTPQPFLLFSHLFHLTPLLSPLPVVYPSFLPPTSSPRVFLFILTSNIPRHTFSHATTATICSWRPHLHTSLLSFMPLFFLSFAPFLHHPRSH